MCRKKINDFSIWFNYYNFKIRIKKKIIVLIIRFFTVQVSAGHKTPWFYPLFLDRMDGGLMDGTKNLKFLKCPVANKYRP